MTVPHLAIYATHHTQSRGRLEHEETSKFRTPFQRDRDRILHSQAFRRLKDKTQVFIAPKSAHTRTRLTHTLEVAQITRTMARYLNVDEDLAETIALSHDLGHPPFGHVGEDALADFMQPYGGFDHNDQALRVVTKLEKRYPLWDGLNLTWETLEGLIKHNGPLKQQKDTDAILPPSIRDFNQDFDLEPHTQSGIESQLAAIADDIAYNHHDMEDGLNAGYFTLESMGAEIPHVATVVREVQNQYTNLDDSILKAEVIRRLMGEMVEDVLIETKHRLSHYTPQSAEDVRALPEPLVAFSDAMRVREGVLKKYLYNNMYRHPDIMIERHDATEKIRALAHFFMEHPDAMTVPLDHKAKAQKDTLARTVLDYLACMTDNYAQDYMNQFNL